MSRQEKISEAISMLDEEIVEEANENRVHKKKSAIWIKIAAAAACIGIASAAVYSLSFDNNTVSDLSEPAVSSYSGTNDTAASASAAGNNEPTDADCGQPVHEKEFITVNALAEAAYPVMAKYPDENSYFKGPDRIFDSDAFMEDIGPWREQRNARYAAGEKIKGGIYDFYKSSAAEFLSGDGNAVYSPVNVYMALAMLAETADGNSRSQILKLLCSDDIISLREQANKMWEANYRSDGTTVSLLANSLWLDENTDYSIQTLNNIAENYFASSYSGDPASAEMQKALQSWLNKQTGGQLREYVKNAKLSPTALMSLCSTIYFSAKWDGEFDPSRNDIKVFHGKSGDKETEFMNSTNDYFCYYTGNDYGAIALPFSDLGSMWLILPDEGKTAEDVIKSGEYLDMIRSGYSWKNSRELKINYSVPKFDISSETELSDGLKRLGVTDIFDEEASDFSPLLAEDNENIYVSSAVHAARVTIDEEGCTATALTRIEMEGDFLPPELEEIDFILDRPFIFVIESDTNQPLFIGVVNDV